MRLEYDEVKMVFNENIVNGTFKLCNTSGVNLLSIYWDVKVPVVAPVIVRFRENSFKILIIFNTVHRVTFRCGTRMARNIWRLHPNLV
jgi:hypothetical protein